MKMRLLLSLGAWMSVVLAASAQDGAWNVDNSGNWIDTGNWVGGTIPSGSGSTAYFTNDITADRTVTLPAGTPVEIGRLAFWTNTAAYPTGLPRTRRFSGGVFTNLSMIEVMARPISNSHRVLIESQIRGESTNLPLTIIGSTSNTVGEIWLTGTNDYRGWTLIGGIARVVITNAWALGDTVSGTVISNGASLKLGGNITLEEPFEIHGHGNAQWGGPIDSLPNSTNTLLALVTLGSESRLGASSGNAVLVVRGGVTGNYAFALQASGLIIITNNPITISGNNNLSLHSGGRTVFAVGSNSASTVEIAYGNTTVLEVDDAFTNSPTLRLRAIGKGTLNMNGRTLIVGQLTNVGTNSEVCAITSAVAGATLVVNQTANTVVTNLFRGPIQLVKGLGGQLWLRGTNDLSGGILVTGGTLRVGHPELVDFTRVPLSIPVTNHALYEVWSPGLLISSNTFVGTGTNRHYGSDGVLRLDMESPDFTGNWEVRTGALWVTKSFALGAHTSSSVYINYQGGPSGSRALWLSGDIGITGKTAYTSGGGFTNVTSTIPGAGDFTNTVALGPGVIRSLSGTNAWVGNVEMTAGAGSSAFAADAGAGLIIHGHVYASYSDRLLYLDGAGVGVLRGTISNGATANLPIIKQGTGTWILASENAASGSTTIQLGTLRIGEGGTIGNLTSGNVDNYGMLVFDRSDTYIVNNLMSGTGTLVQAGGGTTVLTANNTYSGPTFVSNGTLRVDGNYSGGGLITVEGGVLAGVGTVGPVTVNSGGTLAPGASPGILGANGDVTLNSGSTFAVELNGLTAGTDYDQLWMNLNLLTLNNPTLSVSLGFTPSVNDVFDIIGGLNGFDPGVHGTFAGLPDGSTFAVGTTQFQIDYQSDQIRLTVIPEPSSIGLIGLVMGLGVLRRRCRP